MVMLPRALPWRFFVLLAAVAWSRPCVANDLRSTLELLNTGRYRECLAAAEEGARDNENEEGWRYLLARAQYELGQCEAAQATLEEALGEFRWSLHLRLLGHEVLRECGDPLEASHMLERIERLGRISARRYQDAASVVALGRARWLLGADPKQVIDRYFEPAKKAEPEYAGPRMALGELALEKHDYQMAAEELRAALGLNEENARAHLLLARALQGSDGQASGAALARALELNPNLKDALLMTVDRWVGQERYEAAEGQLTTILDMDPGHPEAWAYRAVLAHLAGDRERERECRDKALERWPSNPRVDHVIGRELSEKYRFAEGAEHQRMSLAHDEDFLPARFQLAQDLLRLGRTDEGWKEAETVFGEDGYNVVAYNLMVLHDELQGYRTLERDRLLVRMEPLEAEVYGPRVLDLLEQARDELCDRYRVALERPVTLELFAEQKDFAVRTFGLPGGEGFLGVCFGELITMKSPASQGATPANWEATLWHEFCHAVTLSKTRNRMPRWLSEGISVYEERRRLRAWEPEMSPEHRARVLAGAFTPVSELSGAFLNPKDGADLQFAYYESSMVVEHLVQEHGFDALLALLDDLGEGVPIERSFAQRMAPVNELDERFDKYFRSLASAYSPGAEWEPMEAQDMASAGAVRAWLQQHPDSVPGLLQAAGVLSAAGERDEMVRCLERSLELCPDVVGGGSAYEQLARLYREEARFDEEFRVLLDWLARDATEIEGRRRLLELAAERSDWPVVLDTAAGLLAVQPMHPSAHRMGVRAASALERPDVVVRAGRALLALDPVDPAGVHYEVARALAARGELETAKRQLLMALEDAPRYREAHSLLLDLARQLEPEDALK